MILFLCDNDWANHMHNMANALRLAGVDCIDVKTVPHTFNYESESPIKLRSEINLLIGTSDIIVVFHSCINSFTYVRRHARSSAKIFVFHTGNFYRKRFSFCNTVFNLRVHGTLTNHCEFFKLGAKNMQYVERCVDIKDSMAFKHQVNSPIKIAHYPSNPEIKGTDQIVSMMDEIKGNFDFIYSKEILPHSENMKRISDCDVYIELFKPQIEGLEYGHYGYASLEAASCGKIVITQNLNKDIYEKIYGECPMILVANEKEFKDAILMVSNIEKLAISNLQTKIYKWVKEKHSYRATGERLKQILLAN
ncbi:hypothetical protein LCGC14_1074400 [marine sediment metagenome]|uniref:Glycosyl transferase family 1 domain-containing protein n=1 Tax=marine sediment metagenome TaxID=412755 RepID=A0A0F9QN12_9ZZZZ